MNWLRYHKIYGKDIAIVIDSRSATNDLFHKCRTSLNDMALYLDVALQWVREYGPCFSKRIADKWIAANLSAKHVNGESRNFYISRN